MQLEHRKNCENGELFTATAVASLLPSCNAGSRRYLILVFILLVRHLFSRGILWTREVVTNEELLELSFKT